MTPEQRITKFLEMFNKDDKVHIRTYNMFCMTCSDTKDIQDIVNFLVDSDVNKENLKFLIADKKGEEKDSEQALFDSASTLKKQGNETLSLETIRKRELPVRDSLLEEMETKKIKTEEKKGEDDLVIPGLLFQEENTTEMEERGYKSQNKSGYLNQIDTNKQVHTDSIFYQNILPDPKVSTSLDLTVNKDPYYLFPVLQCKLCGLRFGESHSDAFGQHIEDHRRFTNALIEKNTHQREYFSSKTVVKVEKLDLTIDGEVEEIVWEKESPICAICKKIIKKKWNDKLENWTLDDGAMLNEKEGVHRKCVY
ncbi:mRNA 3' end processing factor [Glugoides intestinalis]